MPPYLNFRTALNSRTKMKLHLLRKPVTLTNKRQIKENLKIAERTCSPVNSVLNRILLPVVLKVKYRTLQCSKILLSP